MAQMNRPSTALQVTTLALIAFALAAFGPIAAAAQGAPAAPPAAAAPSGDAARGKAAFMSFGCYECHGTVGQGNYGAGARIAPHPVAFTRVQAYVRKPTGDMPSFSATILPDKTLADIYAYLSSIPAGKPGSAQPLLNGTTMKPKY
jgi:ubiquinol-cytochrome c reductase cytochrome c subunit